MMADRAFQRGFVAAGIVDPARLTHPSIPANKAVPAAISC
jgi:hypothetical protein